ncbi:MAG: threonylcarbamoyl-AMP synthase [Desulfobacteraceae bacterium]|nr:threonylcarbamoyl-AMP synthase [Desulfobacteraceae bacterium]
MLIKLDTEDNLKIGLKKAADSILSGGVVAIPTESFYGLAVNATNSSAIQRLLDVKERSGDQPILILIPSVEQLDQYVILIPEIARLLMNEFWPGGLTLIFEAKPNLPRELTAGTGKIGVRLSSHPIATALAQAVGSPITATSANISGQPACSSAKEVFQYLGESVDLILDGGKTAGGKGSTVMDVTIDPPVVVREGMVSWEQIRKCLKSLK